MIQTYPSKISIALVLPIILVIFCTMLTFAFTNQWIIMLLFIPLIAFIVHLFLTTRYQITNHILIIKSGIVINKKLDINQIRKIVQTTNPLSSPALSLDRIELFYHKFDSVIISPKDKLIFIEALKQINPNIEVDLKN